MKRYIGFKGDKMVRSNTGACFERVGAAKQRASAKYGGGEAQVVEYELVPTGRVWVKQDKEWVEIKSGRDSKPMNSDMSQGV